MAQVLLQGANGEFHAEGVVDDVIALGSTRLSTAWPRPFMHNERLYLFKTVHGPTLVYQEAMLPYVITEF